MKLVHSTRVGGIAATALAAFALAACGAHSKETAADRAEQRAAEDRRQVLAARADAEDARQKAARAEQDARDAERAQHDAEQRAQVDAQRAADAERRADAEAHRVASPPAGVAERQPARAVLFAPDSAELSADAKARLDEVAKAIRARGPHAHGRDVVVQGYADASGAESDNADLSRRRADAVADYLASKGVARDRIETKGLGSRSPASRENTEHDRALDRRVEILIQP